MSVYTRQLVLSEISQWDEYVLSHPQGNVYQCSFWGRAIEHAYGHKVYPLIAVETEGGSPRADRLSEKIVGVLPLVHIKHFLFGNCLFATPFADLGGVLADNIAVESLLLEEAFSIAERQNVPSLELRQAQQMASDFSAIQGHGFVCQNKQNQKVRMLLDLPETADELIASFKSKLRSQIRRPLKEGLKCESGGEELLSDFYSVFSENMRDLGSPAHAKSFIQYVLNFAGNKARLFLVHRNGIPMACSLTLARGDTISNPWASSLRRFSACSPNMLLYWAMLEYACDNGFKFFDFGRSTPGEGTYKFKKQWGAVEYPLHWTIFSMQNSHKNLFETDQKSKLDLVKRLWMKMPIPIARLIGPPLRKNIGL